MGGGTLHSARVPADQRTAHQEHDEYHAPQHGAVHESPSLGRVSDGYGRSPRRIEYHYSSSEVFLLDTILAETFLSALCCIAGRVVLREQERVLYFLL